MLKARESVERRQILLRNQQFPLPEASEIKSSNQLHNINSYEYLRYLAATVPNLESIPKQLQRVYNVVLRVARKPYNEGFCYGDLYTAFMQALEDYIAKNPKETIETKNCVDALVQAVFINENRALQRSYDAVEPAIRNCAGNSGRIAAAIAAALPDSVNGEQTRNEITPHARETNAERFLDSFVRDNFKPQLSTSQPSVRSYNYKKLGDPTELRLGTQAQLHDGQPRVSPLFKRFIRSQSQDPLRNKKTSITHVYFNDLGRDSLPFTWKTVFDGMERSKEAALSRELEQLEKQPNIAVITLPSDKGIMSHDYVKDQTLVKDPFNKLLEIACNRSREPVQDFYISEKMRTQLFGDKKNESVQLSRLLSQSFEALGFSGKKNELTQAEYQAVWFYFTKYQLTNFILNELNPLTFQMSCKDGIDRGGVHSALYNLMKSFEPGRTPMSMREFEQAIDAAPTMVKGRGMNGHRDRLWNVINSYVQANVDKLEQNPDQRWLLRWHADNRPAGLAVSVSRSALTHDFTKHALSKSNNSIFTPNKGWLDNKAPDLKNHYCPRGAGPKS